ncbi:hypothetical protein KSD_37180 [Ktedonobacter sp. SOSP1-85]|uniref:hypothetical protein n=1 Tax=Ktedonobacter sp. SOSP1-85 TaxID=2778367 RepID=UPI001914DCF7|nr:hypothetical protein [Ktedonobacter sp. SOSP1-85]GHO75947.1 hypothetical protein KSD_37180 [Ktedonobacter sp. SOSP1-85]
MKKLVHFSAFWRQFQLTRADLAYGARLILVVLPPLLIGPAIGQSKLAAMGMLGGLYTAIGGTSGRYRDRVVDMLCIASGMAIIAFLASGLSVSGVVLAIAAALLIPFILKAGPPHSPRLQAGVRRPLSLYSSMVWHTMLE